jgi:apolipoprotein N-acyltransferase
MSEYLGWASTAVFVASYFCTGAQWIKRVQMVGALMWAAYGVLIGALPVVVANLLVFAAAGTSSLVPNPQSPGLGIKD